MKNTQVSNMEELQLKELVVMSTGLLLEKLVLLKTKVIAVHAGHSQLMLLLKVLSLLQEELKTCQNNNLLTVQEPMEIKDAVEVGWTLLSTMLSTMVLQLLTNILMLPETKLVLLMEDQLKLVDTSMLKDAMTLKML